MSTTVERTAPGYGADPSDLLSVTLEDLEWCKEADRKLEKFAVGRDPDSYYEIAIESSIALEQYKEETPEDLWEFMEAQMEPFFHQLDL